MPGPRRPPRNIHDLLSHGILTQEQVSRSLKYMPVIRKYLNEPGVNAETLRIGGVPHDVIEKLVNHRKGN